MPNVGIYDYPSHDIDFCLEKLKTAHDKIRADEMQRDNVADMLGMSYRGGAFAGFISSIEKYGLVETAWGGKVTITDIGKLAIYGMLGEREKAKSDAVSNIELFQELYQKYGTNASEEQIRAFLRQEANVDIMKLQRMSEDVYKIYNNVAKYLIPVEQLEQVREMEPEGLDRRGEMVPDIDVKNQPLKLQFRGVYIQLPPDDIEALEMAEKAIKFMKSVVEKSETEKT